MSQHLLGDFYALINSEKRLLGLTVRNTNDDLIKEVGCTTYEVLVPTREGIECSWIDSCNHNVGVGKDKIKYPSRLRTAQCIRAQRQGVVSASAYSVADASSVKSG